MTWSCPACSGTNPDGTAFCGMCGTPRDGNAAPTVVAADPIRGLVLAGESGSPRERSRALRAERRLVTALFADISGFSQLTDRLDAEQLVTVIDPVVAALSNVIGRYGGVVEKYAGDALLALFGAPVAHTDDAARALRAALELHAELRLLVPLLPPEAAGLSLHVGVNSGHGVGRVIGSEARLDYAVLGDVVVLAQRLEAAAPSGATYVGRTTYDLTRNEFDFEPLGELDVKGKSEPVLAWRLLGARGDAAAAATSSARQVVVGRAGELETMDDYARRLDEGRGGAIFVLGEPGLGKTALCEAMRVHGDKAGWEWLSARCLSYGSELAYWPVADLLRRLFGVDRIGAKEALRLVRRELTEAGVEDALPFLGVLCGIAGAPSTELEAESLQLRMHESVVAVLRARAAARPVVLHVDDLQWADGPTVALLGEIAAVKGTPLLLLASARPEADATVEELDRRAGGAGLRVTLRPLDAEAVGEIVTRIVGGAVDGALVASLLDHTRGNPFFVEEVTRALLERNELVPAGSGWALARGWDAAHVPLTVEGVIAARIDALDDAERDALEVLSVVGQRADLELASALLAGIGAYLVSLAAVGLLDDVGEDAPQHVVFHHPLIHHVVYSRLLRTRRAELHRAVGVAAEALYGSEDASIDLLARHFYLGDEPVTAYGYLLKAAARAERLFANDQAIDHLQKALELVEEATGSSEERCELLLRRARLEEIRGTYAEALSLYQEVHDATGEVRAAVGLASTLRKLGEYDRVLDVVHAARASAPMRNGDDLAALALEEGWVLSARGEPDEAVRVFADGLASVAGGGSAIEGDLLVQLARTEELVGALATALEHAEQARALFEARDDLPRLATTLRILGGIRHDIAGDDPEAIGRSRETLEQARVLARRVGNAEEQGASLINLGQVLSDLGLHHDALRADRDALEAFASVGLKAGVACAHCNLAEHLLDVDESQQAKEAALTGLSVAREIGHTYWITGALIGIAQAELSLGDPAAAAAAAEQAVEAATVSGIPQRLEAALHASARAYALLGDRQRADAAEEQARSLSAAELR